MRTQTTKYTKNTKRNLSWGSCISWSQRPHLAVRLILILLYSWTFVARPGYMQPPRTGTAQSCSCPMCRALGDGHHCACCQNDRCTCHMSSGEDDARLLLLLEPAVFCKQAEVRVILPSTHVDLESPRSTPIPDLSIPTPPPRA